jgi:hypothetical protein
MNRARANRPASGGRIYQKARKSYAYAEPPKGSWDRLLTQTRVAWHHAAGDIVAAYAEAVGRGSMLTAADREFIERNGGF